MNKTPRTCTLYGRVENHGMWDVFSRKCGVSVFSGPIITRGDHVEFIEKAFVDAERERMLDLLEKVYSFISPMAGMVKVAVYDLLAEHGRLGES